MSPPRPARTLGLLSAAAPLLAPLLGLAAPARAAEGQVVVVASAEELRRAVLAAGPGARIQVEPGEYAGGLHFEGVRGAEGRPVVVEARDPSRPPVFVGGTNAMQWTDPAHVELCDLAFRGQTGNGLNVDDGGTPESPAHHVVLRRLTVRDVGPDGNRDGIKLSGLEDFRLEGCTIERWGLGGSAVDMVGCRRGRIEGCVFRHGAQARGSGVQAKGGTQDVSIRRNRFEGAGSRAVNAGGSTGLAYFRPALSDWKGPRFEAKDVRVEGNTFVGGEAPVAFVGVDGATFRFNTVYLPGKWAMRVLQENTESGFVPCRGGTVSDNVIAFRSDRWAEGGVNVGPGTEPQSFRFERNVWYCEDAPARTRELVRPPVAEKDGVYGRDPRFVDAAKGDFRLAPGSPAARAGAEALPK